jgi:hypothetical protein
LSRVQGVCICWMSVLWWCWHGWQPPWQWAMGMGQSHGAYIACNCRHVRQAVAYLCSRCPAAPLTVQQQWSWAVCCFSFSWSSVQRTLCSEGECTHAHCARARAPRSRSVWEHGLPSCTVCRGQSVLLSADVAMGCCPASRSSLCSWRVVSCTVGTALYTLVLPTFR